MHTLIFLCLRDKIVQLCGRKKGGKAAAITPLLHLDSGRRERAIGSKRDPPAEAVEGGGEVLQKAGVAQQRQVVAAGDEPDPRRPVMSRAPGFQLQVERAELDVEPSRCGAQSGTFARGHTQLAHERPGHQRHRRSGIQQTADQPRAGGADKPHQDDGFVDDLGTKLPRQRVDLSCGVVEPHLPDPVSRWRDSGTRSMATSFAGWPARAAACSHAL